MSLTANIDSESAWVSRFGNVLFLHVAFLAGSVLSYGVYAILLCLAIPILYRDKDISRPRLGVLAAILLMFAMSTYFVGVQAAYVFVGLKMVLMDGDGNTLDAFRARMTGPFVVDSVLCFLDASANYLHYYRVCILTRRYSGLDRRLARCMEDVGPLVKKFQDLDDSLYSTPRDYSNDLHRLGMRE
ncbi:hypothetical protein VNI00_010145 [Paramarasmius palmivorus]|uniref:Uncharacterized protein n=1 Tax=Paramarasmius palmivorus TaxID=297713 RepID=A0AAW0CJS1_9AGAR